MTFLLISVTLLISLHRKVGKNPKIIISKPSQTKKLSIQCFTFQLVALELLLLRIKIHTFSRITTDFHACKLNRLSSSRTQEFLDAALIGVLTAYNPRRKKKLENHQICFLKTKLQ